MLCERGGGQGNEVHGRTPNATALPRCRIRNPNPPCCEGEEEEEEEKIALRKRRKGVDGEGERRI